MFAYLISKLLSNIYQSFRPRDVRAEKSASLERTKTSFGSRETLKGTYLGLFETASQENYLLCVYRDFSVGN